jgi:hypothetical protein
MTHMTGDRHNALANAIEDETHNVYTENGAKARDTSGDALVDLFGLIGAMRDWADEDIINEFSKAYDEDPLIATRILFHARDIRGGLGERRVFRVIVRWLAESHPEAVIDNIRLFGEFGRYDDLYALMDTPLESDMWKYMGRQLRLDEMNAKVDAPVSLLAKWIRIPGVSSKRTSAIGHRTAVGLGYTDKELKQRVRGLRRHINIVERQMSANDWGGIDYSTVSSNAMTKHRQAFHRHDEDRFERFVHDAMEIGEDGKPKAVVHSGTLYPYDIVKPLLNSWEPEEGVTADLLEAQWRQLPDYLGDVAKNANVLVIADVSGSMTIPNCQPLATSIGLAMYFAERNHGAFGGLWMDFSGDSQFHRVDGDTLVSRIGNMSRGNWGMNTNLEAAFDRVLRLAIDNGVPQEDMPKALVVISDMEIDAADESGWSFYDAMRDRYAEHGYEIPTVVFWNVNAHRSLFHADASRRGVILCSGSSAATFRNVIDAIGRTPYEAMLRTVNSPRYQCVRIAE